MTMQMPITAEDVVVGIFYHLKKQKTPKLTADREVLHRAFFQVGAEHPDVMSLFSFRQREFFPESAQLDQALSNLDATGLIFRQNLTPKYYNFGEPLETSYRNFSKHLLHAAGIDEKKIKTVAAHIARLV